MFLNLSNHTSTNWSADQLQAAKQYGEIQDLSFPAIDPHWSTRQVTALAKEYGEKILAMQPKAVMCQGEFTFTYALVSFLIKHQITVLAAVSERKVEEHFNLQTNANEKKVEFVFCGFREYCELV